MNKNYIKKIKVSNKKEIDKLSKLEKIIKNLEGHYLSLAFNIWSDPVPKEESENIFINYNSPKNINKLKNININYINEKEDLYNREYNISLYNKKLQNDIINHRKKNLSIDWGQNLFLNKAKDEKEIQFKESYTPLKINKSVGINRKKVIKKSRINNNNIPIAYKIKLSDVLDYRNNEVTPKKNKDDKILYSSTIMDEENKKREIYEDKNDNEIIETDNNEFYNSHKKKEKNFFENYNYYENEYKDLENGELSFKIDYRNYPQTERKINKKYRHINKFVSDKKNLILLRELINKINNKSKYIFRLFFNKWYQNTINYKNEIKKIKRLKIKSFTDNQDNINDYINNSENKINYNFPKKSKKLYKSIISPLGEENKTYENLNVSFLQDREIEPFNSRNYNNNNYNNNNKIYSLTNRETNIITFPKELPVDTGLFFSPRSLKEVHQYKTKSKKKKKLNKKQDLIDVSPIKVLKSDDFENLEISKSKDNLNNISKYTPSLSSKYIGNFKNSFVNKYFKSRAIKYAKEDINPDVIDIQIKQVEETKNEKNMAKVLKIGLHLLRKVIRSFQKRKTKGNSKDIIKIYFYKWNKITEKTPKKFYGEISPISIEDEDIFQNNLINEIDEKNYKINKMQNKKILVKKINNFNRINSFVNDYKYVFNSKNKTLNNFQEITEINDNKNIDNEIQIPKSARHTFNKKLRFNKLTKNKSIKSNSSNKLNIYSFYDKLIKKKVISRNENGKDKATNIINNYIKKINKIQEKNLIYKYFKIWNKSLEYSIDYYPYNNNSKNKHYKSSKNINMYFSEKKRKINIIRKDNLLPMKDIKITGIKYRNINKIEEVNKIGSKNNIKIYHENKKRKGLEKINKNLKELKEQIKNSFNMNNNIMKIMKKDENLFFINNYLEIIKSQNKIISAYKIYYLYYINNYNYNLKLKRYFFSNWLKNNKIFKYTINDENHIISKNKHCINCDCDKINFNCFDCDCTKIKILLKKILIRHLYMKKINIRKYYLYFWYKKVFNRMKKN